MTQHKYIEKKISGANMPGFESLKKEGVGLLHDLCGETWTDFNPHDPGLTILEQICFGLTDLAYRTEFDVVDYLVGKDGSIDANKQALYLPQDIFPSQPVTFNDYRKIIIDSVPDVDNVWFRAIENNNHLPNGLCRIFVDLKNSESEETRNQIVKNVKKIYSSSRNLSEDLGEVKIIKHQYYTLHGEIETGKDREPSNILADIYFRSSRCITPGISFHPFEEMLSKGMSTEDIFSGPLTKQGYIDEEELEIDFNTVTISALIGKIGAIKGINHVKDLWFENEKGERVESIEYDSSLTYLPRLHFPANKDEVGIMLFKNNKKIAVSLEEVKVEFDRLDFERNATKDKRQGFSKVCPTPKGKYRDLSEYSSIQNLFPAIYGVNRYGLPDSESPTRKAQAKQLKAYLLFFDQLMANFLANLEGIPRLFSTDEELKQTYFHKDLNNDSVPNIEDLYPGNGKAPKARIAQILSRYDNFNDRRNRVLDYLLGIYGEKFSQNSLRHYAYYGNEEQSKDEIIYNKIRLLKGLVDISSSRAQAFNYGAPYFKNNNISGLQKKVRILLGIKCDHSGSLTDLFTDKGIKLVPHDKFNHLSKELKSFNMANPNNMGVLSESILRKGIKQNVYNLGRAGSGGKFKMLLKLDESSKWHYPASYSSRTEALYAANELHSFLVALNVDSEGLHIVEHVLLRPLRRKSHNLAIPDYFYSFRISVVFPSWTARFSDKGFKQLAEETVSLNCPAHIFPEFYWLEFKKMVEFECIYEKWLLEKQNNPSGTAELDNASEKVAAFLIENGKTKLDIEGHANHG